MTDLPQLWHYTCSDHGGARIVDVLLPANDLRAGAGHSGIGNFGRFIWLTDLAVPNREVLGLVGRFTKCDRTAIRYRVLDNTHVSRWVDVRRTVSAFHRQNLEASPGARPMHWYVSERPVPVVLDQVVLR